MFAQDMMQLYMGLSPMFFYFFIITPTNMPAMKIDNTAPINFIIVHPFLSYFKLSNGPFSCSVQLPAARAQG